MSQREAAHAQININTHNICNVGSAKHPALCGVPVAGGNAGAPAKPWESSAAFVAEKCDRTSFFECSSV